MADNIQIATYSGGSLGVYGAREKNGEAILALPLSRLIVKMVRIPNNVEASAAEYAKGALQAMSPYPDEELTISTEVVREEPNASVVLAAALPESSTDDIGEVLDAKGLNIRRIDALALGYVRELWSDIDQVGEEGRTGTTERRLVLIDEGDDIALLALDGDMPCAVRAISKGADLKREVMLSLLEAEDFGGERNLGELVVAGEIDATGLESFAPVRKIALPDDMPIEALADRSLEEATLNALPATWSEMLYETRFKAKMKHYVGAAVAVWALVMAVLFGVPAGYGFMTDRQKALSKAHARRYQEVKEMKAKVDLVKKYSDHSRGALEILKAVSDRLPKGVELNSWNFRREEGARFSGESIEASAVYQFKDALIETEAFADVVLTGPSAGKGGKQKFDIACKFEGEEE